MAVTMEQAGQWRARFEGESPEAVLRWALSEFHPHIALASSFSMEDIVLVAMMADILPDARIFALDTGRLHEETYEAAEAVRRKLGVRIEWYFPERPRRSRSWRGARGCTPSGRAWKTATSVAGSGKWSPCPGPFPGCARG